MERSGVSPERARENLWIVDSKGLLTAGRPGLPPHKAAFARDQQPMPLEQVVRAAEPTVLVGATGRPDLFSDDLLRGLGDSPLLLPLSNPTEKAECTPERARRATRQTALVAAGSPFPDTSQCNNVYIFPGVGLGVLSAGAKRVSDGMFLAAAHALAGLTRDDELDRGLLLPPIRDIRRVSRGVALAVAQEAGKTSILEPWEPVYLPYRRAPSTHD
jgi:malic enzyme